MATHYFVRDSRTAEVKFICDTLSEATTWASDNIDSWISSQATPSNFTKVHTSDDMHWGAKTASVSTRKWIPGLDVDLSTTMETVVYCICIGECTNS